ncbi:hypothetical protein PF005_g11510 [Phytophthora fragariae]|uniref:HAT C-terminal dimerisation domain-containing protein n=1 Tax=Phytophthora fragariae TaxID=53985 RepID=A0A6A3DP54_9STRA|nr:hypothetical protein PF009_g26560 [Phytophthora fragariae]KAE9088006.1 hypothetical protein PF007_g20146 [Phytophthora fragariae]KAE9093565.1 hypothetical protein PF006_g24407 [Phytophthora fragariae]KAE9115951.1 hypothetical protein PF010_g9136 [Phytophthora fragariae]KAE9201013.1 hypothetical protein PF004_g18833 [Phytophthora fragariae]
MGGRILNEYAEEHAQQKNMELIKGQEESGGRVNFLSDVWQNISKNHLLGAHLVLFGIVVVEGLHAVGSEHHGIALARQMEAVLVRLVHQGWNVGAVLTDNAGQCERARRILAGRWPSIHFGKCFAHDINNLVKAILKRTSFRLVADQACAAVNALNGSSSKWLPRAEKVIMETYELNKPLAFLSLCYTRWNSMQGCFASLLRVKTGLKQFATRFRYYSDLPSDVLVFNDETFWTTLEDAEQIIRPLCNASYILQRDENTLVDVVLCFRGIFDGFVAGPHARELIPLVEERWNDCEQPLFILALFLHPRYREAAKALPNEGISSIDSVCNYAVFYFKRFFRRDPGMLRDHMDRWCSDTLYVGYEKLVYGEFETAWRFWSAAKRMKAGPNLPDLAIAVLSIAANTATCERYFSQLGRIHTPVRNCLKAEKTNEAAITGQAIRECDHQEAKTLEREKDQDSDENEVVEEDSDGNKYLKYAGRIVKAEERQYRGDISTSNPAPDQVSINGVLIRPIASAREFQRYPDYRPSTPSRPPGTPRRHSPTPSRPPVTPSRSHSMSRPIPATPSRPYSKMPQVVPEDQESARKLCSSLKGYHQLFYLAQLHQPAPAREIPVLISDSHAAMGRHLLTVPPPSSACSCLKTPMCESELDRLEREGGGESRPVNDFESSHETDVSMDEADEEVIDEENLRLQPIPDYNDTSFFQEPGILPGLRGAKSKLVELFSLPTRL